LVWASGVGRRRLTRRYSLPKTLWDWLQLLIVPVILIAVTLAWSAAQTKRDNRREDRRIAADRLAAEQVRQDATLNGYLAQMSDLMLNKRLLTLENPSAVREVARIATLTTLHRLGGERKIEVVRFLSEAQLLATGADGDGLVSMEDADLTDIDLRNANLDYANLAGALLNGADLRGAKLRTVDLSAADLGHADLRGAVLGKALLSSANLKDADLEGADLAHADLAGAKLEDADLRNADLRGANLMTTRLGGTSSAAPTSRAPTSRART
jgi:uncharacterized protein YjbI with pentapeptide repeats